MIGWSPPYLEFNAQHEVKIILELVAAHMWEGSSYIALKMGVFNKSRASKQAAAAMNLQSVQNSWGFFSSNWNTLRFLQDQKSKSPTFLLKKKIENKIF